LFIECAAGMPSTIIWLWWCWERYFWLNRKKRTPTVAHAVFNDLVTALEHLLPRRYLTAEELADIINKRHYLRRKAKGSHARRSQVMLE